MGGPGELVCIIADVGSEDSDLTEVQTDKGPVFKTEEGRLLEVQTFSHQYAAVFAGNTVCPGPLHLATQVDPLFLVHDILAKSRNKVGPSSPVLPRSWSLAPSLEDRSHPSPSCRIRSRDPRGASAAPSRSLRGTARTLPSWLPCGAAARPSLT